MGMLTDMIVGVPDPLPRPGARVRTLRWEGKVVGLMQEKGKMMWLVKRDGHKVPSYYGPELRRIHHMEVIDD